MSMVIWFFKKKNENVFFSKNRPNFYLVFEGKNVHNIVPPNLKLQNRYYYDTDTAKVGSKLKTKRLILLHDLLSLKRVEFRFPTVNKI